MPFSHISGVMCFALTTSSIRECNILSLIDELYRDSVFSDEPTTVRAVLPERTFLEKVFLLHEEFSKPKEEIRVERMSRHMYDIVMMMGSDVALNTVRDKALYRRIIEHRKRFLG